MQKTGLKGEKDLAKISRRPGGRFNVIQCCLPPDSPGATSEQQTGQNRREVVAQYVLPSDPSVVLTLRYGINVNPLDLLLELLAARACHFSPTTGIVASAC